MALGAEVLTLLRNRLDLTTVPFTDRSSRILLFRDAAQPQFHIRICERWPKLDYIEGDYRTRPPLVRNLSFTDGDGRPLPFTATTYPHRVDLAIGAGALSLTFADPEVLVITLPPGRLGMRCAVRADRGEPDARGATFRGARNVALTTNARIVSNRVEQRGTSCLVDLRMESGPGAAISLNITPRLGFTRSLHPEAALAASEARWRQWFDAAPPVDPRFQPAYAYAWWVMGAGLISSRFYLTREAMVPSKVQYVGVWQWDAFFHALAYRHVDARLATDQFRIVLDHQRPNGMLPDAVYDDGVIDHLAHPVDAPVTKPPIAAWAVWKVYETTRDLDFLAETYEALVRWNEWWFTHADDDRDGIAQYSHPYSSGLDDSPLWDGGMPVESPDLSTYLCVHMEALAKIAAALGRTDEAAAFSARAADLVGRMIEHFYDPDAGVFWAVRSGREGSEPVRTLTPFSLYPLWTGGLPVAIAQRLVRHLTDPASFWLRYPIPTVAKSDPHYDPARMWRGPVWANINYLFIEALLRAGFPEVARELCDRTLELIAGQPDMREFYDPETGLPPPQAAPSQGWTAAVFIDLAIRRSRGEI